jgi:hypothetical protein
MRKNEEIQIAFNIWELLSQLSALLWEHYFDEFNLIMYDLEKQRGMDKLFPFKD